MGGSDSQYVTMFNGPFPTLGGLLTVTKITGFVMEAGHPVLSVILIIVNVVDVVTPVNVIGNPVITLLPIASS